MAGDSFPAVRCGRSTRHPGETGAGPILLAASVPLPRYFDFPWDFGTIAVVVNVVVLPLASFTVQVRV